MRRLGGGAPHALGWPILVARTVLVVDEDAETREALADLLLASSGFAVVAESDPVRAWNQLGAARPVAVIAHWRMKRWDGISFLRRVATAHPRTARILITGALPDEVLQARANDRDLVVLEKPFDGEKLLAILVAALDARAPTAK
jgi:DNA-binding NtrC family response regulator